MAVKQGIPQPDGSIMDPYVGYNVSPQEWQRRQGLYADREAKGLNDDGSPKHPEWNSEIDPATGKLKDQFQLHGQGDVQVDQRAQDEIRNRALETGPSQWAQLANQKQGLEETAALDNNRAQSAGSQAQTFNQLAMNGGLQSGSRERLAKAAMNNQVNSAQGTYRQGQLDRAGIGLQDQANKNDFLKQTAANDFSNANLALQNRDYSTNVDKTNLQNLLGENTQKRVYDSGIYSADLKKWGDGMQADAARGASGGAKK